MRSTIVQAAAVLRCALLLVVFAPALRAQTGDDDPFARRSWHLELGGHAALETWNYNISHEEMFGVRAGLTYGLGNGITLLASGTLYYVDQRGVDGCLMGATVGLRGRVYRKGRVSLFLEAEVGSLGV